MLTSSPKISDLTRNHFFKLNLAQSDENVGQKCFSADFSSFWDSLSGKGYILYRRSKVNTMLNIRGQSIE